MFKKSPQSFSKQVKSLSQSADRATGNRWHDCIDFAEYFQKKVNDKENIEQDELDRCLLIAAKRSNHYMAKFLGMHKANPNFADNKGNTALHYAVDSGNEKLIQCLIEMGADATVVNEAQQSPLDRLNLKEASTFTTQQTLNNIATLLTYPDTFQKQFTITSSIFNISDLDTVLVSQTRQEAYEKAQLKLGKTFKSSGQKDVYPGLNIEPKRSQSPSLPSTDVESPRSSVSDLTSFYER